MYKLWSGKALLFMYQKECTETADDDDFFMEEPPVSPIDFTNCSVISLILELIHRGLLMQFFERLQYYLSKTNNENISFDSFMNYEKENIPPL